MLKYWVVFSAKGKIGDGAFVFDEPIAEKDMFELKYEIVKILESEGIKCESSEVIVLNWKKLNA